MRPGAPQPLRRRGSGRERDTPGPAGVSFLPGAACRPADARYSLRGRRGCPRAGSLSRSPRLKQTRSQGLWWATAQGGPETVPERRGHEGVVESGEVVRPGRQVPPTPKCCVGSAPGQAKTCREEEGLGEVFRSRRAYPSVLGLGILGFIAALSPRALSSLVLGVRLRAGSHVLAGNFLKALFR